MNINFKRKPLNKDMINKTCDVYSSVSQRFVMNAYTKTLVLYHYHIKSTTIVLILKWY